jgi:hypothetical protein
MHFDDNYYTYAAGVLSGISALEAFIVIKLENDPPLDDAYTSIWSAGGGDYIGHYPWTDGTIYENLASSTRKTIGNPTPSLASWRVYNVCSATNIFSASLDGVNLYKTSTNSTSFLTYRSIGGGAAPASELYRLKGWIAEVVFYDRVLTMAERSASLTYFSDKYNLGIVL